MAPHRKEVLIQLAVGLALFALICLALRYFGPGPLVQLYPTAAAPIRAGSVTLTAKTGIGPGMA
jgi:hypothetical protein